MLIQVRLLGLVFKLLKWWKDPLVVPKPVTLWFPLIYVCYRSSQERGSQITLALMLLTMFMLHLKMTTFLFLLGFCLFTSILKRCKLQASDVHTPGTNKSCFHMGNRISYFSEQTLLLGLLFPSMLMFYLFACEWCQTAKWNILGNWDTKI